VPTAAELITKIEVHGVDKYSRDMRKVEQDTNKAASGMDSAGKKAGGFGASLASIGGTAALGGIAAVGVGLGSAVKIAGDFESSLNAVSAATGATSDDMKAMRAEALKIGADTSKGASEAVEAMGELTKSGISVQDAVGGVARTVVQMSEASGSSVANMATLMSDSLNVFNLGADQAGDAANTLVKAAGASSISIDDLAYSLSAGGLVAKNAGLSIGDFSAAIGILGNQGLKSSDAGTSLKAMIAGLTPTTDKATGVMKNLGIEVFDAAGNYKSFEGILAELSEGFAGLTQEQRANAAETLFGSDGIRAFNALIPDTASGMADAVTQFQQFNEAMGQAPSVAEQSEKRLQGLGGEMEKLKGSLETVAIEVGTVLLPSLTQVAAFLATNIGPAFETLKSHMDTILPVFGAVAAGLGAILVASTVAGAITTLVGAWTALSAAMGAVGPITAIVAILGGPLTLAIVGIGAAIAVLVLAWTQNWGDIQGKTQAVINFISPIIDGLGDRLREFGEVILPELAAAWQNLSDQVGTIANGIRDIVEPIFNSIRDFLAAHRTEITAILQGAWDAIVVIVNTVTGIISNNIQFWLNILQGDWDAAWQNVKNIVSITWDGIKQLAEIFLSTVLPAVVTLGMDALKALWNAAWNEIKASVDNAINGENGVIALVRAMPGAILAALAGIGTLLFQVGADLISGFINGVNDRWDDAIRFVGDLFDAVVGGVKGILGIESPSTVMRGIGVDFIKGFIDGTGSMAEELKNFVTGLVGGAVSAARDAAGGFVGALGDAGGAALGAVGLGGGGGGGDWARISGDIANQYGLPPALVAAMAWHESGGGNLNAVGDSGNSFGLFQMHVPAHGGSAETWTGVQGAYRGAAVMSGRWISAFNRLGGAAAYNADPEGFLMRWAPQAQGSIAWDAAMARRAMAAARAAGYAEGGTVKSGWFTVGERGFELGHLGPQGLQIFSNEASKALIGTPGGMTGYQGGSNTKAEMFAAAVASPGGWTPALAQAWFEGMEQIAKGMEEETREMSAVSEEVYRRLMRQAAQFSTELGTEANKLYTEFAAGLLSAGDLIAELRALLGSRRGRLGAAGEIQPQSAYTAPMQVILQVNGQQLAQAITPAVAGEIAMTVQSTSGAY
jgi:TP901 family phage tail tape measure protein